MNGDHDAARCGPDADGRGRAAVALCVGTASETPISRSSSVCGGCGRANLRERVPASAADRLTSWASGMEASSGSGAMAGRRISGRLGAVARPVVSGRRDDAGMRSFDHVKHCLGRGRGAYSTRRGPGALPAVCPPIRSGPTPRLVSRCPDGHVPAMGLPAPWRHEIQRAAASGGCPGRLRTGSYRRHLHGGWIGLATSLLQQATLTVVITHDHRLARGDALPGERPSGAERHPSRGTRPRGSGPRGRAAG